MRAGVPRCIEHSYFDGSADAQQHPGTETDIDTRDTAAGTGMREHLCAGGRPQTFVATDMVAVLVSVEDAPDGPTSCSRNGKTGLPVEWIDGHGIAGFLTGDEVVVIAPRVSRPNAFDDHLCK